MRLIHLPTSWTIVADFLAWLLIHLGVVYLTVRIPAHRFNPEGWLFKIRGWEKKRDFYPGVFKVKKWKAYLPDAAPLMGARGFPKKRLQDRSPAYLRNFCRETCRAELTHWVTVLFAPLFFFWNPFWVGVFMIFYALAENIPLIMAQRYNRSRLRRVLAA